MKRRDFTIGLLLAAAARSVPAQEPAKRRRIAIVIPAGPVARIDDPGIPFYRAFWEELRRLGDVEGKNLTVERYSGEGRPEGYADLAREVVNRNPQVIVAGTDPVALAARAVSDTIPIVWIGGDPIQARLATSLAHPGGNITGVSVYAGVEIWGSACRSSRRPSLRHPTSRSWRCARIRQLTYENFAKLADNWESR